MGVAAVVAAPSVLAGAVVAAPVVLAGARFTSAGVAAGSLAAMLQVLTCTISLFIIINNDKTV